MKPPHPVLWFNSIQPSIWLMSCVTAIRLERIQREPLQRSGFRANVRQSQHLHPVVSRGPSSPMTDFQPALARPLHELVRALRLQAGVTVTPGTEFSPHASDSIRLNFSQNPLAAWQAMERISQLIERYRA